MRKQVYISADYAENDGDRDVVYELKKWGNDDLHKVNFVDMAEVKSGSVAQQEDCRICDLKKEFNKQINASSAVIAIVGDKTASRTAGSACERASKGQLFCSCTPYKQNTNGKKNCKINSTSEPGKCDDVGCINSYSYLKHEFKQAEKKGKVIVVLYNSLKKEPNWLPAYMKDYEVIAVPFWTKNNRGERVGNYTYIKEVLGF